MAAWRGPGILTAMRDRVDGDAGGLADTDGFGLFFVWTIVEAWDARLRFEDNDTLGTVVSIDLESADEPLPVAG